MVVIDEKQEAIARIRMAIDNDIQARQITYEDHGEVEEPATTNEADFQQWQFGSPEGKRVNLRVLVEDRLRIPAHREYCDLDQRLRAFIAFHFPEDALSYEDEIFVSFPLLIVKHDSFLVNI